MPPFQEIPAACVWT